MLNNKEIKMKLKREYSTTNISPSQIQEFIDEFEVDETVKIQESKDNNQLFFVVPINNFNLEQLKEKPLMELYNELNLLIKQCENYQLQIQYQCAIADAQIREKYKSETSIKQKIYADKNYNLLLKNMIELNYRKRCYESIIKFKESKLQRLKALI